MTREKERENEREEVKKKKNKTRTRGWKKEERRGEGRERKRETRRDSCRFVHVGTEGSPAGSQSNKVVRGCFAGCKFSPPGLSVSILPPPFRPPCSPAEPLSLCNCEPSLYASFRDTRKWPRGCSTDTIAYYTSSRFLLLLLLISVALPLDCSL